LPSEYFGIHIRQGDKIKEVNTYNIDSYFLKAKEISSLRNAFISTDDYRVIEEIKANYPDWNIYYLCKQENKGYYQNVFQYKQKTEKEQDMYELFASIEILAKSTFFIGTFTSNIGMFLGIRRQNQNCFGVDLNEWIIW
jgi:hypothetical protein